MLFSCSDSSSSWKVRSFISSIVRLKHHPLINSAAAEDLSTKIVDGLNNFGIKPRKCHLPIVVIGHKMKLDQLFYVWIHVIYNTTFFSWIKAWLPAEAFLFIREKHFQMYRGLS